MKIAMIGTGYVGLVSGTCFADFGHDVVCVDKDQGKIDALLAGRMPIFEPGLDALVATNVAAGRLSFTTSLAEGIAGADAVFIAVGTPSRRGDGHADLSYVYAAAAEIGGALTSDCVVVTKSTVPVGTGDEVERILHETAPAYHVPVVSNPEFLREGAAISDFKRPDRIVIGTADPRATLVMREIYRPLFLGDAPLMFTARRSAELIKYAANAFLATKITFINEVADLCEAVGADVRDVAKAHILAMTAAGAVGQRIIVAYQPSYWVTQMARDLNEEFSSQGYKIPTEELKPDDDTSELDPYMKVMMKQRPYGVDVKIDTTKVA